MLYTFLECHNKRTKNMKCKVRVTCVRAWMCMAVCGCLVTLILAAVVLSSYNFETVIGPLVCQSIYSQISKFVNLRYHFHSLSSHAN